MISVAFDYVRERFWLRRIVGHSLVRAGCFRTANGLNSHPVLKYRSVTLIPAKPNLVTYFWCLRLFNLDEESCAFLSVHNDLLSITQECHRCYDTPNSRRQS